MMARPTVLPRVQFVTVPEMKSALGTITSVRSKVSIRVERTEMSFTIPMLPFTSIQSPSEMGRSISRMMPETKLLTTFCRPKPIPTDSAPTRTPSAVRSIPPAVIAMTAASPIPR
jgi:hypothetical protein